MTIEITNIQLMKEIQQLKDDMLKIPDRFNTLRGSAYESSSVNELYGALAKAQLEMEVAKTDASNPFYKSKYADLSSIVKASRPFLAKNGLAVIQRVIPNGNGILHLFTRLCHSSGQWMESKMPILPPKQDIQTLGSYITYLRRYNYAAIAGVVASDEDDDGESAMEVPRKTGLAPSKGIDTVTKAQVQVISSELEGFEEILESLLKGFKIAKLSDLPAKSYTNCVNRIRDIKRAKEA